MKINKFKIEEEKIFKMSKLSEFQPTKYNGNKLLDNIMLWLRSKILNKDTKDLKINLDTFLKEAKIDKNQFLTFVSELDKTKKVNGFDITVDGEFVIFHNFENNTKDRIWEAGNDILTFEYPYYIS